MLLSLNVETLWKATAPHKFNAVAYGKLFQRSKDSMVTIGEDGVVWVYDVPLDGASPSLNPIRSLETKCGPASHILLKDITRLSPCDMLVSDTRGSIVLFCDGQILVKKGLLSGKTAKVTALTVQETGLGHMHIIVGRDDGEVMCFNTFSQLWKLRLRDLSKQNVKKSVSVSCVMATSITTSSSMGNPGDYLLVSDTDGFLHVVEQGEILLSIPVNSTITTMTCGCFLQFEDSTNSTKSLTQIALGCSDGSIWICVDFTVDKSPYADVGHPVCHLRRIPARGNLVQSTAPVNGSNKPENVDLLVCGGHFSSLKIYQYGKIVHSIPLPSWPISLCGVKDSLSSKQVCEEAEDDCLLLIGCQDSSLQLVSIT